MLFVNLHLHVFTFFLSGLLVIISDLVVVRLYYLFDLLLLNFRLLGKLLLLLGIGVSNFLANIFSFVLFFLVLVFSWLSELLFLFLDALLVHHLVICGDIFGLLSLIIVLLLLIFVSHISIINILISII